MIQGRTLPRARLLSRAERALRRGHLFIEAPGGYGKSTLLRALAGKRPGAIYIGLTSADADLAVFQARLTPFLAQPSSTLLLDDIHLAATDAETSAWLAALLEQPPGNGSHFVLAGRSLADLNASLLTATGQVEWLTAADLAFKQSEAEALGVSVDQWQRAEGWPLALALFHHLEDDALSSSPTSESPGALFEALAPLVLAGLTPDVRAFLHISAVPLRFNLDLIAYLLNIREIEAARMLDKVRRRALFLQPAEVAGWYRYHDLIRTFLLTQNDPTETLLRTSVWFETHDDVPMAIEHALLAEAWDEAARLILHIAGGFVSKTGRYRTFKRWVESLPPETLAANPLLPARMGHYLNELGLRDEAERAFAQAMRAAVSSDADTRARVQIVVATARVMNGQPEAARAIYASLLDDPSLSPRLRRALYKLVGDASYYLSRLEDSRLNYLCALSIPAEPSTSGVAEIGMASDHQIRQNLINVALIPLGRFGEAASLLEHDEEQARQRIVTWIWHLLTRGWLQEGMGDWKGLGATLAELRTAQMQTETHDEEDSGELMLYAYCQIGTGDFAAADETLERISRLGTENPDIALYTALGNVWLARRRGDPVAAIRIATEALAQPWDVPLSRSILTLELECARMKAVEQATLDDSQLSVLHPELSTLVALRARSQLVRLHALLALRCHRAQNGAWRRHLAAVMRALENPGYGQLLTARDPELGSSFWALCVVEGIHVAAAHTALREIGQIEPLVAHLSRATVAETDRIAAGLAFMGNERAIPYLAALPSTPTVNQALADLESTSPPHLRITVLGHFAVERDGEPIGSNEWKRPAARKLLQYFALQLGRPVTRDRILEDLWPDTDPAAARDSFKTTFSHMRKAIEPWLRPKSPARYFRIEDETYTFGGHTTGRHSTPSAQRIEVDAIEFARTIQRGVREADPLDAALPDDNLVVALEAYASLLPDGPLESWLVSARETLADLYVRGCLFAAERFLNSGRPEAAEPWAERAVIAAPWSEEGYQALMRAQARQGGRSRALRTYAVAIEALARELDATPSTLTTWLAERLRQDLEI